MKRKLVYSKEKELQINQLKCGNCDALQLEAAAYSGIFLAVVGDFNLIKL